MKIGVLGLWHLGTVTAACLASLGFEVRGIDNDSKIVDDLSLGSPPIFEPGLEELLKSCIQNGNLTFISNLPRAVVDLDVLWVCIDTPVDENDNANVNEVLDTVKLCLEELRENSKVIISSQLPVGSIAFLEKYCQLNFPAKKIIFACSPENLRLGNAISIFLNPDRIIVGVRNQLEQLEFANIFSRITDRLEWMSIESAEMTKHAINSFLANSIVFANEIAIICECVGADAKEVERGLKSEARIGPKAYLSPGGAFAGGTLARDIQFLNNLSSSNSLITPLINSIRVSNDHHKDWIKTKLLSQFRSLSGKNIALWGLVYKAGTNTLRRSEAVELGNWLIASGAKLHIFDPSINNLPDDWESSSVMCRTIEESLYSADALVIGPQFKEGNILGRLNGDVIKKKNLVVIDPYRNFFDSFGKSKTNYFSVGLTNKE